MSRDDWCKVHTVCFIVCPSLGLLKYIETKLETTCFHLTQKGGPIFSGKIYFTNSAYGLSTIII